MSDPIGKLLPQSARLVRIGGEHGLTGADISHACSMASRIGYLIVQAKYGDDKTVVKELSQLFYTRIIDEAEKERWKRKKLASLVNLAVLEFLNIPYTDKKRAELLKMHPSTFLRVWKKRYYRLFEILSSYEQSTLYLIKKRLK